MATKAPVDPDRLDREARDLFLNLTPAPTTGRDQNGRPVTIAPSERFTEITRRARFIVVSDTLAQAVVALLARQGVHAGIGHVHVDPAAEGDEQVLGLHVPFGEGEAVVPLRPATAHLRAYPTTDRIDLTGHDPLFTLDLPAADVGQDGWVPATTIATALTEHLAPPTS